MIRRGTLPTPAKTLNTRVNQKPTTPTESVAPPNCRKLDLAVSNRTASRRAGLGVGIPPLLPRTPMPIELIAIYEPQYKAISNATCFAGQCGPASVRSAVAGFAGIHTATTSESD